MRAAVFRSPMSSTSPCPMEESIEFDSKLKFIYASWMPKNSPRGGNTKDPVPKMQPRCVIEGARKLEREVPAVLASAQCPQSVGAAVAGRTSVWAQR